MATSTKKLSNTQERVLAAFLEHGPMNDEILVERTGINMRTASPRRRSLADLGLLEEVGKAPTRSGRMAVVWAPVSEDRVAEVRDLAAKRDPRRQPVTSLPLEKKLQLVRELLDDAETNEAVQKQNGRAWRKVRARNRDRTGQREHERREMNRLLKEAQKDPTGLVDFLKAKRNLLDVMEAMRGTSEFLKEEMENRRHNGHVRIPTEYWPDVQDLLVDLEELGRDAREAIDDVMGRLGDDVIEGYAIEVGELELTEGETVAVD
jgi:hypothetical protein